MDKYLENLMNDFEKSRNQFKSNPKYRHRVIAKDQKARKQLKADLKKSN